VRRAINYAIDRRKVATLYGGVADATPTCQVLPPGFLGYHRYCPYTVRPAADGKYNGPDLARARALVAASGTRGDRVDVWGFSNFTYLPHGFPAYVASVLRAIGYRSIVHLVPFEKWNAAINRRAAVVATLDWLPDFPSPSDFVPSFFGCNGSQDPGHACDPEVDRLMTRAVALQSLDRSQAAALWTEIDHRLVEEAWWAPTVNPRIPELTSKSVGNYQVNPIDDFITDQIWVR
jgi:peptide/nickel transport system substrate-binding protein